MVALKKYGLNGQAVGEVALDDAFLDVDVSSQMVKDYLVAIRTNARQWSANTKGRSEVKHTTKKPHRQKGTGSARQGSLVTAQFRGGGIVFGPKPKFDQHVRINRKERRKAVHALLAQKIKGGQLVVMEDVAFSDTLKKPETKVVSQFLRKMGVEGRRVLFVGESAESDKHAHFKLSMRNIPRALYSLALNLNGYDVAAARTLVITESALGEVTNFLSNGE